MHLHFSSFEPLMSEVPYRVLDYHPNNGLVALQILTDHPQTGSTATFSGIWNVDTRKIVWSPDNATAMAWDADGREICLIREQYSFDPAAHQIVGGALEREYKYTWERYTWPEKRLITSCPLIMPTGWPEYVAVSPGHTLAVFQWFDQSESGLEFITITEHGDFQLLETGLRISENVTSRCLRANGNGYPVGSNLATAPTFSPNGRYVVFGWHDDWTWWANSKDGHYVTNDTLARVEECRVGFLEIIDWEIRCVHRIAVLVNLPSGWHPSLTDTSSELMGKPEFIDNEHFNILLPTGETRTYQLVRVP